MYAGRWRKRVMWLAAAVCLGAGEVRVPVAGYRNSLLITLSRRAEADDLKRRPLLGVAAVPLPAALRQERQVPDGEGLLVQGVGPETPAAKAGVKSGDVLLALNGSAVRDPGSFVQAVAGTQAGETVKLTLWREGKRVDVPVGMEERPRERADEFDVVYGSVTSSGKRLRTLVTRPRAEGKRPALLLIQGLGGFSIDNPPPADPYRRILHELTRAGYVTMRVDKPGVGDSEGPPYRDTDFQTELDGYRQALKALKGLDYVDAGNVFIFGHSMGGIMGPIIASENPVRGIAVYGTVVRTWHEYVLENLRRQLQLRGENPADVDRAVRDEEAVAHHLFVEGRTPEEIAAAKPELKGALEMRLQGGRYLFGRDYRFFRQLAGTNLPSYWLKVNGNVLALWGKGDFVSSGEDHALIARIVEGAHPGQGEYRALDGIDHGFNAAASQEESLRRGPGMGEFNPLIIRTLREWMDAKRK